MFIYFYFLFFNLSKKRERVFKKNHTPFLLIHFPLKYGWVENENVLMDEIHS